MQKGTSALTVTLLVTQASLHGDFSYSFLYKIIIRKISAIKEHLKTGPQRSEGEYYFVFL